MILRNDADDISLSVLDELHLLVYLCSVAIPSVSKSELVSQSISYMSYCVHNVPRLLGIVGTEASMQQC
jgi:hypothetical protein